jgi:hypothetical protein
LIATIEPGEEENNNKTAQQRKRTLYCIGCGNKKAAYLVRKENIPLCQEHWEIYAREVLHRRSIEEEEELT